MGDVDEGALREALDWAIYEGDREEAMRLAGELADLNKKWAAEGKGEGEAEEANQEEEEQPEEEESKPEPKVDAAPKKALPSPGPRPGAAASSDGAPPARPLPKPAPKTGGALPIPARTGAAPKPAAKVAPPIPARSGTGPSSDVATTPAAKAPAPGRPTVVPRGGGAPKVAPAIPARGSSGPPAIPARGGAPKIPDRSNNSPAVTPASGGPPPIPKRTEPEEPEEEDTAPARPTRAGPPIPGRSTESPAIVPRAGPPQIPDRSQNSPAVIPTRGGPPPIPKRSEPDEPEDDEEESPEPARPARPKIGGAPPGAPLPFGMPPPGMFGAPKPAATPEPVTHDPVDTPSSTASSETPSEGAGADKGVDAKTKVLRSLSSVKKVGGSLIATVATAAKGKGQYYTAAAREQTFSGITWPHDVPSLDDVVEAGFISAVKGIQADRVKCFDCGIILNNWEPKDIPKDEHRKARPTCGFVLRDFVDGAPAPGPASSAEPSAAASSGGKSGGSFLGGFSAKMTSLKEPKKPKAAATPSADSGISEKDLDGCTSAADCDGFITRLQKYIGQMEKLVGFYANDPQGKADTEKALAEHQDLLKKFQAKRSEFGGGEEAPEEPATSTPATGSGGKWEEYFDDDGFPYYFNTETQETVWEKPDDF